MFGDQSGVGVGAPASPFVAAYQRLVGELEGALWYDDAGQLAEAYQQYTDASGRALADPVVAQEVSRALERLTAALARVMEHTDARPALDAAATRYLREIGEAWPQLRARETDLEALVAIATGMTTLAWLFGLGASGLVSPFGSPELFPTGPAAGAWLAPGTAGQGNGGEAYGAGEPWSQPPDAAETRADPIGGATHADGDEGIVWKEFTVGDDGEIVQRDATPAGSPGEQREPAPSADAGPGATTESGGPSRPLDPAELVERAYAAYVSGLQAAGAPVTPPPVGTWGYASPAEPGLAAPGERSELQQRAGDLSAAYLRLMQGIGSLPEVYAAFARYLGASTALIEQQLSLARGYERLIAAAMQGQRPGRQHQAVDAHYRRFLTAVREAWTQVEPADLTPERLAAMNAAIARGAALHQAAKGTAGNPLL
jgi:hypothetical protein